MGNPLMAALQQRLELKQSVLSTARNLASRASIYGVTNPTAYRFLARQGHCSPRTAMRHIHILEEAKIVEPIRQKRIVRRKDLPPTDRGYTDDPRRAHERVIRNEINQYRFVLKWDKSPQRSRSSSRPYDTESQNLPHQEGEKKATLREEGGNRREKQGSVREDIEKQYKFLRDHDAQPGSMWWEIAHEEIARLEALLPQRE
jgi:hypothetical protein